MMEYAEYIEHMMSGMGFVPSWLRIGRKRYGGDLELLKYLYEGLEDEDLPLSAEYYMTYNEEADCMELFIHGTETVAFKSLRKKAPFSLGGCASGQKVEIDAGVLSSIVELCVARLTGERYVDAENKSPHWSKYENPIDTISQLIETLKSSGLSPSETVVLHACVNAPELVSSFSEEALTLNVCTGIVRSRETGITEIPTDMAELLYDAHVHRWMTMEGVPTEKRTTKHMKLLAGEGKINDILGMPKESVPDSVLKLFCKQDRTENVSRELMFSENAVRLVRIMSRMKDAPCLCSFSCMYGKEGVEAALLSDCARLLYEQHREAACLLLAMCDANEQLSHNLHSELMKGLTSAEMVQKVTEQVEENPHAGPLIKELLSSGLMLECLDVAPVL